MMQKLKKIWLFLLGIMIPFWLCFQYVQWGTLRTWDPKLPEMDTDSTTKIDNIPTENIDQWSHRMSEKTKWILHLPEPNDYDTWLWYVIALIQIAINWLLGMLAVIALVYILYCGFLILSSWSDDKNVSKGKKWISNAAVAIAGIGLSWLVISAMIWFINIISRGNS